MTVLDVCCGSRAFWFDKDDPRALFLDNRTIDTILCDGRRFTVNPDMVEDFRNLSFHDDSFPLVVFDPPHMRHAGEGSWLATKYGRLGADWQEDLRRGFAECFRVLRPLGTLIFKWCEDQVKLSDVLALTPEKPLFGNRRGKTFWVVFQKAKGGEGGLVIVLEKALEMAVKRILYLYEKHEKEDEDKDEDFARWSKYYITKAQEALENG